MANGATVVVFMVASLSCACSRATEATATLLTGDAPWVVPPELRVPSESQSDFLNDTAPNLALRDVELDWYKVTGYRAMIYSNDSWNPATELGPGDISVFFGDAERHPYLATTFNLTAQGCGLERGDESHCLFTVDSFMWGGALVTQKAVVAVGNGTRGAIYAAYAFSEHILGVAPFYKFTFGQPLWRSTALPVPALGTTMTWGPPTFKHRTIFLNDEELLGFFRRDPLGEQIFDPSTFDSILETLLRAKGNCIIPGTTPYPDERSVKLAARRGVIVTASHFEILGFNAFAWSYAYGNEATKLWDWTSHPDIMMNSFEAAVDAQKDYEMIWSVGLRGLNDYAYPNCEQDSDGPMGCGSIISQAISNQTALLSRATGKPIEELNFKFNLWVEALSMYQKGLLKLPNHTSLVMSDSGAGFIRGDPATYAAADGVYYHVQMLNGDGGQITEFVPPSRIFEQLSSFSQQARSTSIFVLNLSDLKPAVLTAAAALSFVWNSSTYFVNSTDPRVPNRTADAAQDLFLADWVSQQFPTADPKDATSIATMWSNYFELPWIAGGSSDEALAGAVGGIASALSSDLAHNFSVSAKTLQNAEGASKRFVPGLTNATLVHEAALALLPNIPPSRSQFFKSHGVVQSAIQRYSVEMISLLVNATEVLGASQTPGTAAIATAAAYVNTTLATFDLLFQAERDAEGSEEWRGMYWGDRHRFTNFQARRRQVLKLQAVIKKLQYSPASQIDCCQREYAYQWTPSHLASYPLFYDDPEHRARDFVMISCSNVTADGGRCINSAQGGKFWKSAQVQLSLVASLTGKNDTIVYSVDGSEPSVPYKVPIVLSKTTTIKAAKVDSTGQKMMPLERNVTYEMQNSF